MNTMERIKNVLSEFRIFGFTGDSRLADIGISGSVIFELIKSLEEKFDIDIDIEFFLGKIKTINDLVVFLEKEPTKVVFLSR